MKLIMLILIGILFSGTAFSQNNPAKVDSNNNVQVVIQNGNQHSDTVFQKGKDQFIYLYQNSHADSVSHGLISNQTGNSNAAFIYQSGTSTSFSGTVTQKGEKNTAVIHQNSVKGEDEKDDLSKADSSSVKVNQTGSGNSVIINQN